MSTGTPGGDAEANFDERPRLSSNERPQNLAEVESSRDVAGCGTKNEQTKEAMMKSSIYSLFNKLIVQERMGWTLRPTSMRDYD